jgi:hypothetical protein
MLYIAVVVLTMLVLPIASVIVQHAAQPEIALMALIGRWFVFWGAGVRLMLAGLRQSLQPRFTAREIFHMESDEALPLVRELGVANIGIGILGLTSLLAPSFVLPAAIYAAIFYGFAGIAHTREKQRSFNETLAMTSDLFIALVFCLFVAWAVAAQYR